MKAKNMQPIHKLQLSKPYDVTLFFLFFSILHRSILECFYLSIVHLCFYLPCVISFSHVLFVKLSSSDSFLFLSRSVKYQIVSRVYPLVLCDLVWFLQFSSVAALKPTSWILWSLSQFVIGSCSFLLFGLVHPSRLLLNVNKSLHHSVLESFIIL